MTIEQFDVDGATGDFLAYSQDGSYPSEQEPVRVSSPGRKELTFQGETAIFEFVSDEKINANGFLARYNSDFRQEKPGRANYRLDGFRDVSLGYRMMVFVQ